MNLSALIAYYIPTQMVEDRKKQMFDMLFGLLLKGLQAEGGDAGIQSAITDNLFSFLSDIQHLKLAESWLIHGYLHLEETPD